MKLIVAIVQDEDASKLIGSLMTEGYRVTKLATTGGFLRSGNSTLMIGAEDEKVAAATEIIEKVCKSRKRIATQPPLTGSAVGYMPFPIEVNVGGATVFVLDVDQFYRF